ncbi:MAG TPA: RraA family protein [Tepidisphaeraceae bacterium]|jgi:regulator of RNase E activity RraA|nr:RraA family protein [Tepidisphaeraceae bacterium]
MPNQSQPDRLAWIREHLYVPVLCDVLDSLGYRNQAMHQRLRPLDGDNCTFVGRARTLQWIATNDIDERDPYGLEIDAVDSLKAGDVVVHSTDTTGTVAPWGELMSTICHRKGVAGCVCDALVRDCKKIMAMRFAVFHNGIRPLDSKGRGRVTAYDVPIQCGGIMVHPGELIVADYDGIVVVPHDAEEKAITLAAEKVGKENSTRRELLKGRSLRDVFNEFGVL